MIFNIFMVELFWYGGLLMYKMIVTDLDGTLLDNNKNVSDSSKKYLKELKDNGYIICVDTGRTIGRARYALEGFDYVNYIIGNNGTFIYDVCNDKSLYKSTIKTEDVKELFIKYLNEYEVFEINSYENILSYRIRSRNIDPYVEKIDNKDEFFDKISEVYNVIIRFENENMVNVFLEDLKNNYKDISFFIMENSFAKKRRITLINKNDNKFNGICILKDKLGINNKDIIAFGDGLNDLDMIKNVGFGVAMKNALNELKNIADDITRDDNNNDGVINYLKSTIK